MPHIQIIQLPANQNMTASMVTGAQNNHQKVTLEWAGGQQDVFTTTALQGPPFQATTPFGNVQRNSGASGILKVTVEHQNAGAFVGSAVTVEASQGPGQARHTLGALDATPGQPALSWEDSKIIVT